MFRGMPKKPVELSEIKRLLDSPELSIPEIAYQLKIGRQALVREASDAGVDIVKGSLRTPISRQPAKKYWSSFT